MPARHDALFHPLYLSARRGLEVDPYAPIPDKRSEALDWPERPVRDRTFHVEHMKLELDVDVAAARLSGVATLVLRPLAAGLVEVRLDASELRIGRVVRLPGTRLKARHDGETLVIQLDRAYGANETVKLAIAYRGRPRRGLWFVRPDRGYPHRLAQAWSQGQAEDSRAWFPCVDHPNDKFTSEIVVTADSRLKTVANGRLRSRRRSRDGRRTTWHWVQERPHPAYLVSLAVAPFVETRGRGGRRGVPLRFYAFPGQERAARRLYGRTADMVRVFERLFGPYPYREYSTIVVSEFTWGGMENTGATTLTDKAITDDRAALDISYEGLVAHELAHQWWGDLATCRGWNHNWLNEGWATFCEILYDEAAHGLEAAGWTRVQKYGQYLMQDAGQYRRPIVFGRYQVPTDLFDRHAYEKGSLVLWMLRDELGDELFFRGARRYLQRYAEGFADTHEFRRVFEEESGRDLSWFFRQWVYGAGYPELSITWKPVRVRRGRHVGRGGDAIELVIRQTQKSRAGDGAATPVFQLGLDVAVHGARGAMRHRIRVTKARERFVLASPGRAVRVAVDPGLHVLKELVLAQPAGAWLHALGNDRSPFERMRAARELAGLRNAAIPPALMRALERDPSPHVRMAAAIALGEGNAKAGRVRLALVRALRDRSPDVRRSVTFALGRVGRRAERDVLEVLGRDRSYLVRATALKALAQMKSPRLLAAVRRAMDDRGWRDLVPMAALDALAMAKLPDAFEDGYAAIRYGEMQEVRDAGVRLLVTLAGDAKARRARPEEARHVVPTLIELMRDPSVFTRLAAIGGAGKLGKKELLPALRRVMREESWDHLQRTAQKAIAEIAGAKRAPAKGRGPRRRRRRRRRA